MTLTHKNTGALIVGLVLLAIMLFPVYWVIVSSLETSTQIFHSPPFLFPPTPVLTSYSHAIGALGHYLINSVIICAGTVLLTLVLGAPAAYGLAHLRLRLTLPLVLLLLLTQMFPSVMLATPLFLIFNSLNLVNSYLGLILADATISVPFVILLLRAYLLTVPFELTEAALVDGTTLLGAFMRVVLPVSRGGLVTAALFTFLFAWGDFLFALTLTTRSDIQPVTLGLYTFIGQFSTAWNDLMAGAVFAALPAVILLVVAQRFVSAGLTAGAIKG